MKKILFILSAIFYLIGNSNAQTFVESRPDKNSAWKQYAVEQFSDFHNYQPKSVSLNKYGSNTAIQSTATGFFRTELINGRWYIIDPEGYAFIHKGVACVSPGTSDNQKKALQDKWGTNDAWATYATSWLKDNNFNGAGAWSDVTRLRKQTEPIVYTVIVNPMSNYRNYHRSLVGGYTNAGWQGYEYNIIRVFDPKFEEYLDNACKLFALYKNDKYLLGYFIDNELPWVNDALDRHIKYLAPSDICYITAKNWLDERKGKNATLSDITNEDRNAFWDFYAGKFFKMAKEYITKYDPNHMFLGSRFNQGREELVNPYIFETAGKYCDIISINHYREWEPIAARMENWESWAKKPFMITEFYTKGEDSGLLNSTGAGWLVKTQRDRGLFYENFIIKLLRSKGCVGWHWFRYQDNDPEDLTTDPSNRDSNKGLIDIYYNPYTDLMDIVNLTNENVYSYLDYLSTEENVKTEKIVPKRDTYIRLMSSETDIHGKEPLLRVKNSNGSTYERTSLLEFDLTPFKDKVQNIKKMIFGIKLLNVYPGANDPSYVTMNAYNVSNLQADENKSNSQLFSEYSGRSENSVGSTSIPVSTSSRNMFFEIDLSNLIPSISEKPIFTLRLQMDTGTETQFEFASRENTDVTGLPYISLIMPVETSTKKITEKKFRVYNRDLAIHIEGLIDDTMLSLYDLKGQCLFQKKVFSENRFSFPIQSNWTNLLILKIISEQQVETHKLII